MSEDEFGTLLLGADPDITKYSGDGQSNRTVWFPGTIMPNNSDDQRDDYVQRIYIDRYTKIEADPIVAGLMKILDESFISYEYVTDYEQDTGYIHHSFTCYVGNTNESEE